MVTKCCVSCGQLFAGGHAQCPRCGASLHPSSEGPPVVDGRYLIEKELGRGGAGRVLLATDVPLRRRVALKVLANQRPDRSAIDGFYREASALASVRSEHVAQVHSFGLSDEGCFFAMEFIAGSSLSAVIDDHRRASAFVPKHRGISVLRQVANGLAAVHAQGVIHRDVKPSNIVIERDTGRAVLVDFGIAIHASEAGYDDEVLHGTPAYMAPEQIITDGGITPLADVYALGCTAFEVLTGQLPFRAESIQMLLAKQVSEPPPTVSSVRPELGFLDPIVLRAMAKEPTERFESAKAFASALDHALFTITQDDLGDARPVQTKRQDPGGGAAVRVLVIDDDPVFGVFASRAVKSAFGNKPENVSVTVVRSGADALALDGALPNLVLLDYHMPGMSGVEVLSVLRERPGGRELRVIVASGSAGPETLARFALLGVTEFVKKPVDFGSFVQRLRELARINGWIRLVDETMAGEKKP
ncbi:MAG: protein kinase [Myxococcales bacterium]|nr:protein kinase [Myxococcales bacterium]